MRLENGINQVKSLKNVRKALEYKNVQLFHTTAVTYWFPALISINQFFLREPD